MNIVALIPARGGSKGVLRKNIRDLAGKPLIAYTIRHALNSKLITRTIVSTDDAEIANLARAFGAETPFLRPAQFAQDMSPDIDVFLHAAQWLKKNESYVPDLFVHLRPTHPVRDVSRIDEAIELMMKHPEADSLRAISLPKQTPYKMWSIKGPYLKQLLNVKGVKEPYNKPRQSLPKVWWQNGYVDIVRTKSLLKTKTMLGKKILAFPVKDYSVEIDYEEDFVAAEKLLLKIDADHFKEEHLNEERHSS